MCTLQSREKREETLSQGSGTPYDLSCVIVVCDWYKTLHVINIQCRPFILLSFYLFCFLTENYFKNKTNKHVFIRSFDIPPFLHSCFLFWRFLFSCGSLQVLRFYLVFRLFLLIISSFLFSFLPSIHPSAFFHSPLNIRIAICSFRDYLFVLGHSLLLSWHRFFFLSFTNCLAQFGKSPQIWSTRNWTYYTWCVRQTFLR